MSHIFSLSLCSLLPWENRHNQKRIFKSCHHCICKPSIYAYLSFIIYYGYIVCPSLSQLQCLISFIPKLLEKEFYYRKTPCLYSLFLVCSVFFLNQFQSDIHFHWSCFFFFLRSRDVSEFILLDLLAAFHTVVDSSPLKHLLYLAPSKHICLLFLPISLTLFSISFAVSFSVL